MPNFLLCRGCQALQTRDQLEEDWGLPPSWTPRRVLSSLHQHWWNWTESSSPVYLPGVYHHIRCQDQQRSRQQTGQGKQHFWQTLQKNMELQASEEEHKDRCLSSCHTHHHAVWLCVMGNLRPPPMTSWSLPSVLSPHHPQHSLE